MDLKTQMINRGHSRGALWRGDSENHFAGLHYVGGVDISFKKVVLS